MTNGRNACAPSACHSRHRRFELFERRAWLADVAEADRGAGLSGRDPEEHPVTLRDLLRVLVEQSTFVELLGKDRDPRRVRRHVGLGECADRVRRERTGALRGFVEPCACRPRFADQPQHRPEVGERDRVGVAREHRRGTDGRPRCARAENAATAASRRSRASAMRPSKKRCTPRATGDLGVELRIARLLQPAQCLGRGAEVAVHQVVGPDRRGRRDHVDAAADALTQLETAPVVVGGARRAESLHAHVAPPAYDADGELRLVARRVVGRRPDQFERAVEIADRFGVGGCGLRRGGRNDVLLDGLVGDACGVEVLRDQPRVDIRSGASATRPPGGARRDAGPVPATRRPRRARARARTGG